MQSVKEEVETVRVLMESGSDLRAQGADESTPLHWAASRGQAETVISGPVSAATQQGGRLGEASVGGHDHHGVAKHRGAAGGSVESGAFQGEDGRKGYECTVRDLSDGKGTPAYGGRNCG